MAVLSTLQNYFDILAEQVQGPGLDVVIKHKWSILAGTVAAYAICKYLHRPRNLPPGPFGLPVIGSLHEISMSMDLHLYYLRISERYKSDIVSFYLGKQLNVALNSAELVKLAFSKTDAFTYRDLGTAEIFATEEQFFTQQYSEEWKKFKTFCMSSLKTHGFGTVKSEENMKLQLTRMINHIDSLPDETIESDKLKELISKAGACIITKILANQSYEFDDPELNDLIEKVMNFMKVFFENVVVLEVLVNVLPKLILWPVVWKSKRDVQVVMAGLRQFFLSHLEEHRATLDENNARDLIDDFLIANVKTSAYTDLQMVDTIMFFSPDAIDTTGALIGWVILYICWFQDVQEKMLKEIKSVCGESMPGFKDRNRLPYCEAALVEGTRMSTIFPMSITHVNVKDAQLKGYHIPKNTLVTANLYAVHYDERVFPEPTKFKPERFLTAEGELHNLENVMPFSTGYRKCVGEPLTKSQIFYYATGLVQKFHITFADGGKPDSLDCDNIYRLPPGHKMKFTPRY